MRMTPAQPEPLGEPATAAPTITCWTNTRVEIRSWLHRNAPSLAELYEGAVILLDDKPIPGRVRFIGHAVREIRNRLPDIISGPTKKRRLDYTNRLDDLARLPGARILVADLGGEAAPKTTTTAIDRKLALKIAELIQDHLTTRTKPLDSARRLFESIAPENSPQREGLIPVIQQWFNTTEWFMKNTHDSGYGDDDFQEQELRHRFSVFETTLSALIKPFFDTLEELDAILEDANT
jgi:hypothetical protein